MKINFKKSIFLFSILLIFIVSIGSISASDMENNADLDLADSHQTLDDQILSDSPLADDGDEGGSDPQAGEGDGNDDPGGDTPTGKTFEEIQNQIDSANENDDIELNGSYAGDSYIIVNKSLTIKGISEDTSLDLNDNGQYLYVDGVNVIFENLNFVNTKYNDTNYNGYSASNIVLNNSANCSFIGCSFINCMGTNLIWADFGTINIENCIFDNCTEHNSLLYSEGPIFINNSLFEKGLFENCIYSNFSEGLISNSNFTGCGLNNDLIYYTNASVINCNFRNIRIPHDDACVVWVKTLKDSTFINCINRAPYTWSEGCYRGVKEVENCKFINSTVSPKFTTTKTGSTYGNITLKIKLVEYYCGDVIPNQTITIEFFDPKTGNDLEIKPVKLTTDKNGEVTYKVSLDVGQYGLRYECHGVYVWGSADTGSFRLNVTKTGTVLNVTKLTTTYNSGKTFNIKVQDKNTKKAVSGVKLSLKVYTGKKYKTYTVTTDKNGLAKFKASTLAIGSHKVVITGSNKNYVISKKESTIKINKAPTTVKAPKVTYKYKKSKYFKVTVINKATKKAVSSINIKIKVYTGKKYKTYTRKTNSKGLAKLNTKSLKKGTHKVVISSGNAKYTISKKSTIVIKK